MSFTDFLAAIESQELREIAAHWNNARAAKRMPGWKDIDPAEIAPHLPIVWSWKYDGEAASFTGRLAGEKIVQAHGRNLKGKRIEDFFAGRHYESILANYKRVVAEPAFACERGQVFIHTQRIGLGERIMMPLAANGIHGDGILGATVYSINRQFPAGDAETVRYPDANQTDFFSLD